MNSEAQQKRIQTHQNPNTADEQDSCQRPPVSVPTIFQLIIILPSRGLELIDPIHERQVDAREYKK